MKKIILNHKSYLTYNDMINFIKDFDNLDKSKYEFILFPQTIYLSMFVNKTCSLGTQNFYSSKEGSFTGEINLESLKSINVKNTLIGQYERRKIMDEQFDETKEKLFRSLNAKFNTFLCIGEDCKTNRPFLYIKRKLNSYLKSIEKSNLKYLSIVYEPSYSHSNAVSEDLNKISTTIDRIKSYVKSKYTLNVEVLYGGYINEDNISQIINICDGIVIGKQSTNIKELIILLKKINK